MAARYVLGDASERTLALGPLDIFPVAPDEATTFVNGPPPSMRRATGISVAVQGATVLAEEELAFLIRPSSIFRVNHLLRGLWGQAPSWLARVRSLWARVPSGRVAWNAVATRVPVVMDRVRPVVRAAGRGMRGGAAGSARAMARLIAAFHAVDRAQKRTAAGAFLAGVLVTSIVAWIV